MGRLRFVAGVLGFVVEVEAVGWLWFWLGGWCYYTLGRWFAELLGDMLFVELAKVVDDWLWRSGRIANMLEVGLDCFVKLVVERVKDRMENVAGSGGAIAWCG
jgi:hypothetical protein